MVRSKSWRKAYRQAVSLGIPFTPEAQIFNRHQATLAFQLLMLHPGTLLRKAMLPHVCVCEGGENTAVCISLVWSTRALRALISSASHPIMCVEVLAKLSRLRLHVPR